MTSQTLFSEIGKKPDMSFSEDESYKRLRAYLLFSGVDTKVISVTSTVGCEGKSKVSFNIAMSLAELGKNTLFIDADMRNSKFLERYHTTQTLYGLAHYLVGDKTLADITRKTVMSNLSLITYGAFPPNPSELLGSEQFETLISSVREMYDYVIIDCPPIAPVVDGLIISSVADGVVFVIESGTLSARFIQESIKQLRQSNCRLIGCVLNKYKSKSDNYGGYSGYSGYKYGYGYGYGKKKHANNTEKPQQ